MSQINGPQNQSQTQLSQAPVRPQESLFAQYSSASTYDEFFRKGEPRPGVKDYYKELAKFGGERFEGRWSRASRTIDENSMGLAGHLSQKVFSHISPRERRKIRAWKLDAVPLVVDQSSWDPISAAVAQRAMLCELMLQDLYGPQRLIKEKIIPASLLYSHPGFLRSVRDNAQLPGSFLSLVGFDLARSPDGRWWFINDRTESPSGIGFAHENRSVISQAFPELFQHCQVAHLSPFFEHLQYSLLCLSDRQQKVNGVLLGEGITGRNFFEEAYLARTLGYSLVQGDDLTVRNDGLHLKTLAGLKPVDLVFRRKSSRNCDPLEFDGPAIAGTPGFANAIRQRQFAVANKLGTGLVESRAFMAYSGVICKFLMSQELLIPNVATWWCGDPQSCEFVLNNLDRLSIESAFRSRGYGEEHGRKMNKLPLEQRREKILRSPEKFAAQEKVDRSSVPVWEDGEMQSSRLAIRTFALLTGNGVEVMPGGLGRTSRKLEPLYTSVNRGEGGKDIWVQSDDELQTNPTLSMPPGIELKSRGSFELSSRLADNLFWLGRQIERIYFCSRLLRATIQRLIGENRTGGGVELRLLVRCLAMQGQLEQSYAVDELRVSLPSLKDTLLQTVLNASLSGSVATAVNELMRIGQMERNFMSLDTWRTILRIHERIELEHVDLQSLLELADELIVDVAALAGFVSEGMTRDQVYGFIQIGRRIEHSTQLVFLLRSFFVPRAEPIRPVFKTALEVADSIMTYRSRYFSNYQVGGVLDLLVTDELNPRSLVWQLLELNSHIEQLPAGEEQHGLSQVSRQSNLLLNTVRTCEIHSLAEAWLLDDVNGLESLLETVEEGIPKLQSAITNRYFVHADMSRQINEMGRFILEPGTQR